jgi:hypothetical protein
MERTMHSAIMGAAALAALAGSAAGTTRYVNGNCGNDAWTGTSPVCAAPDGPKPTIQAAIYASGPGDEVIVAAGTYPGTIGLSVEFAVRSAEGASATIIDGEGTSTAVFFGEDAGPGALLEGFTITGGYSPGQGGGAVIYGSPTIRQCVFTGNHAAVGSAVRSHYGSPWFDRCTFSDNSVVGAGTVACNGNPAYTDCVFRDNVGQVVIFYDDLTAGRPLFLNCRFTDNSGSIGGAAVDGDGSLWVNCVFSRNVASGPTTSTIGIAWHATIANCTFTASPQDCVWVGWESVLTVANSVIRGSDGESIVLSPTAEAAVSYSDIEGGWPGTGNIDAEPLFVQPGTDDLRLSYGSPCADAGSVAALPPDALDLDGDGNTSEPVPLDLAGAARVQDGTVDMGAYEGQFAPGAPAAGDGDLDEGELAILVPEGGPFNPVASPAVLLVNLSGGDNAQAMVTQIDGLIHPGAGGYSDLGSVLVLETSLGDGEFRATVFVPFDSSAIAGAAPQEVRATWYDPGAGNWALGVWGNTGASPGFTGPIGERFYAEAPGGWGLTQDAGDYGVYWEPATGQGFAWANVDHASDFGAGISPCPGDCRQAPDGEVNIVDMLLLLNDWGSSAGSSCDVDSDGTIGAADFAALLNDWGPCTVPAMPGSSVAAPPRTLRNAGARPGGAADLDASGDVGRKDLEVLLGCWGEAEPDCAADLDHDGSVGLRDYLRLLSQWGSPGAAP